MLYAWFSATPNNAALSCSALFDAEGAINPLGQAYSEIWGDGRLSLSHADI